MVNTSTSVRVGCDAKIYFDWQEIDKKIYTDNYQEMISDKKYL